MTEQTRWSLTVSRDTDAAVRSRIAAQGEGELSRFVEQAVNRELLRETVREIRDRNADIAPAEADRLAAEALAEVRRRR